MVSPIDPMGSAPSRAPAAQDSELVKKTKDQTSKINPIKLEDLKDKTINASQQEKTKAVGDALTLEDTKAIKEKSSAIWECLSRVKDDFGGYLYTFKLKDEFDEVTDPAKKREREAAYNIKIEEIFPAVEIDGSGLKGAWKSSSEITKMLTALGMNVEQKEKGLFWTLPDRVALEARWEKLREKHPSLPELKFVDSDGIAGDLDFVNANLNYDGVISLNNEFIHDMSAHVMILLTGQIQNLIYSRNKIIKPLYYTGIIKKVKQAIKVEYEKIRIIEKILDDTKFLLPSDSRAFIHQNLTLLQTQLGAFVDSISATPLDQISPDWKYSDAIRDQIQNQEQWRRFFVEKFGEEALTDDALNKLNVEVNAAVALYKSREAAAKK